MKDVKKRIIFLCVLMMIISTLTACGSKVTTYTYENEAVLGVKIKETEVYPDKLVVKFAKDSLSEVESVTCYGEDFSVIEENPEFTFNGNTLTIETQHADMVSGLYIKEHVDFYINVRYLDSDAYAMLAYSFVCDVGDVAYGDEDAYYTQEEKDEQEARAIELAEKEKALFEKLLGTWINESETVRVEIYYDDDQLEKMFTVYEYIDDEWVEQKTTYITTVRENKYYDTVEIELYDNPYWGASYDFYLYNDNVTMESEFSEETFVKTEIK